MVETLLFEIERHCNNYFNPQNDPAADARDYPASFLELAGRIAEFNTHVERSNVVSESIGQWSGSRDLEYVSWQKAFAKELSIFKRAKFI